MVCLLANKYCMKISLCITNHNQHELVYQTIEAIKAQTVQPDFIYVCSDDKSFLSNEPNVICINNKVLKGRCQNRNSVIKNFLNSSSDALVFIDGDTCPKNDNFIEKYEDCFKNYDLVFGTREHTNPIGLKKPPSDLLTANMDNLWNNKPLSYEDLRVASNAVNTWQNSYKFYEKLDLMVTGMIGWSCNFGFTKEGLKKHLEFMKNTYGNYLKGEASYYGGKIKEGARKAYNTASTGVRNAANTVKSGTSKFWNEAKGFTSEQSAKLSEWLLIYSKDLNNP